MEQDFDLVINDVVYRVVTPQRERISRVCILLVLKIFTSMACGLLLITVKYLSHTISPIRLFLF